MSTPRDTVRFSVTHTTSYEYSQPMVDGFTSVCLLPRATEYQTVRRAELSIDPLPDEIEESVDPFGNRLVRFAVHVPHTALRLTASSDVVVSPMRRSDVAWPTLGETQQIVASSRGVAAVERDPFVRATPMVPLLDELAGLTVPAADPTLALDVVIEQVNSAIFQQFDFDPGVTDVTTPLATVLAMRRGVCQDFAHVAVGAFRRLGLAARYVSGYIETVPPPGQPRLVGADASHAWCSVWVPTVGWVDIDPTNDQFPPRRHVTVAWGRDYADVAPVRGVVIGPPAQQSLTVSVDVLAVANDMSESR
jgi:transglutaminase-like putative cysteine protease